MGEEDVVTVAEGEETGDSDEEEVEVPPVATPVRAPPS
jgi:hypothetical protein